MWSGTGDQLAAVACIGRRDHTVCVRLMAAVSIVFAWVACFFSCCYTQLPAVIVADVSSILEWSMIRPPADVAVAAHKSCPTFEILSEATIAVASSVFALSTSYISSMDCPGAARGTACSAVARPCCYRCRCALRCFAVGGVPIRMLSGCPADSKLLGCAWVPLADSVVTCDSNKTLVNSACVRSVVGSVCLLI